MERSSVAVGTACDIQVDGRRGPGRPKLTWKKLTENNCHEWKLTTVGHQEKNNWRSDVKCARLSERRPIDNGDTPAPAR